MAYNEDIDHRIVSLVADWRGVERRKMFGGTCHLLDGHMFCGVSGDQLILRLGEARASELRGTEHISEFDITGRPMKGWVMVDQEAFRSDRELARWLALAKDFVISLPAKNN